MPLYSINVNKNNHQPFTKLNTNCPLTFCHLPLYFLFLFIDEWLVLITNGKETEEKQPTKDEQTYYNKKVPFTEKADGPILLAVYGENKEGGMKKTEDMLLRTDNLKPFQPDTVDEYQVRIRRDGGRIAGGGGVGEEERTKEDNRIMR